LTYKIRYMTKDDLPQVVEIDKEAFPTQWPPTNYKNELQNNLARYIVVFEERETVEILNKLPDDSLFARIKRFFGFKEKTKQVKSKDYIVGFAGCWIMADELHITEIAARANYRGKGIGHLLLIKMVGIGQELRALYATLEVRASNVSAQKLYEKFGFEHVGVRKAYYTDNREDALIMTTRPIKSVEYQELAQKLKIELARKWGLTEVPPLEKLATK
jgi:[ribosomal protein S18]-alanine N-acetyltransferase